jgi:serine O-acetyltransferase
MKLTVFSLIKKDLFRYAGTVKSSQFIKNILFNRGFKITFYHRLGNSISRKNILFPLYKMFYECIQNKYTLNIPLSTKLGDGIYIWHPYAIAINKNSIIGNNVNISQCVTIGLKQVGEKIGVPTIGNSVYIGPGAIIIGAIHISDGAVIGANSVVTTDVPQNAVVAGAPAKILSYNGSEGLVCNRV